MGDKLNIFISHKHENEAAATAVKQVLSSRGGRSVDVFMSEEIPAGDDWFAWIKTKLVESNVLLLMYTDPSLTWDWCFYEAGMFTGLKAEGNAVTRVICLYNPNYPPPTVLDRLQAVPATTAEVAELLTKLYGTTELTGQQEPINEYFARDTKDVALAAEQICSAFSPPAIEDSRNYTKYLDLLIKDPRQLTEKSIPADAIVKADPEALKIFGLGTGHWTWAELERQVAGNPDLRWLAELRRCIHLASKNFVFDPIQAVFHTPNRGSYQPMLTTAQRMSDGSMLFRVIFVDTVVFSLFDVPNDLGTLVTLMRFSLRFRYEVIEKYAEHLAVAKSMHDQRKGEPDLLTEIQTGIQTIESDVASRGKSISLDEVLELFDKPADRSQLREIDARWGVIRAALFAEPAPSIEKVRDWFEELKHMNARFMKSAARRYQERLALAVDEVPEMA